MVTKKKETIKKIPESMNVRLTGSNYAIIKGFCDEKGYKIGAFVENAALKRILSESGKA